MKKIALCLAVVSLLVAGSPLLAEIGTIDAVPAATLLIPFFAVDLDNPDGLTTLFSVNNASATAILAHVVFWTDLSVPTLDFNIYLTGYDVQTVNIRDIFIDGNLPRTASVGQDPGDAISPHGAFSQDINFASCAGQLPYAPGVLPGFFVAHLQAAHTGHFSTVLGGCAGQDLGDNVARGYITVDTVSFCTLDFPGDAGYFISGGAGTATNQNVLWGDYFYVNSDQNFAQGDTAVHIEASGTDPRTTTPGNYTFYGRYDAASAADNREPLATTWATRYAVGGAFTGGTHILAWRDSKIDQGPFACGSHPFWYPLSQTQVVIFDEQEHPQVPQSFPVSPPIIPDSLVPFPAEANDTTVGGDSLPVPFNFGWLYLNLNTTVPGGVFNPYSQAWVSVTMDAEGRFSVGYSGIQLDNASAPNNVLIGN